MRGSIGLLLYVAVVVLGSVMKKLAEDRARQTQGPMIDEAESYTVTLENMVTEAHVPEWSNQEEADLARTSENSGWTTNESEKEIFGAWDDWEDQEDWLGEVEDDGKISADAPFVSGRLNLKQAIIMSEIIREPRAKRAWPSR